MVKWLGAGVWLMQAASALAQGGPSQEAGGEAGLKLPDLSQVSFHGLDGHKLLLFGIVFCFLGLLFGLRIYVQLKNLPVHMSMREISELIYETCKTYLVTQGKFILVLWAFIAVVIGLYFGWLAPVPGKSVGVTLPIILLFSILAIAATSAVPWFRLRFTTFPNSPPPLPRLPGHPSPLFPL